MTLIAGVLGGNMIMQMASAARPTTTTSSGSVAQNQQRMVEF